MSFFPSELYDTVTVQTKLNHSTAIKWHILSSYLLILNLFFWTENKGWLRNAIFGEIMFVVWDSITNTFSIFLLARRWPCDIFEQRSLCCTHYLCLECKRSNHWFSIMYSLSFSSLHLFNNGFLVTTGFNKLGIFSTSTIQMELY